MAALNRICHDNTLFPSKFPHIRNEYLQVGFSMHRVGEQAIVSSMIVGQQLYKLVNVKGRI